MEYEMIDELREILVDELSKYDGDKPVLLTLDQELLQSLIFNGEYFADIIENIKTKINYENISFNGFNASDVDFSVLTGVKIEPLMLYNEDLSGAICAGVEFIGSFEDVMIYGANFKGSKGAKINPKAIWNKDLTDCVFADVEFIGAFEGVSIKGSDFTGSKGAKIDPHSINDFDLRNANFCDVEFIGSFEDVQISGSSFKGSKGAKIDPLKVSDLNFNGTDCADIQFIGSFEGIDLSNAKLDGSNYNDIINYKENFREKIKLMIYSLNTPE